LFKIYKKAL